MFLSKHTKNNYVVKVLTKFKGYLLNLCVVVFNHDRGHSVGPIRCKDKGHFKI